MHHKRSKLTTLFAALAVLFCFTVTGHSPVYAAPLTNGGAQVFAAAPAPAARPLCNDSKCVIDRYVDPFIKAFSALAGVIIVISIIAGGIQYSSAGGDPNKVGAAKARIGKSIGALVFFIFLYAALNYLVPGGIGN